MTRRHITPPSYYRATLWRPDIGITGRETWDRIAWDMEQHWLTTSEWLAWVRRRDGRKMLWNGYRWQYPVRPQIAGTRRPSSTMKIRRLP